MRYKGTIAFIATGRNRFSRQPEPDSIYDYCGLSGEDNTERYSFQGVERLLPFSNQDDTHHLYES